MPSAFPYDIKPDDLKDPELGRLNRMFQYVWTALQKLFGDNDPNHFLNGAGVYTPPLTGAAPKAHNSIGEQGQMAYGTGGELYWCYAKDHWARLDVSGWSNTF